MHELIEKEIIEKLEFCTETKLNTKTRKEIVNKIVITALQLITNEKIKEIEKEQKND